MSPSIQALLDYVREVSQSITLELDTLEGISIAENYRDFTKGFDTGFGPQDRLDVSDLAVGVTPLVLRKGQLGSHIIFPSSITAAFGCPGQPMLKGDALYTIAHELAHADEHHRSGTKFAAKLIELHMTPDLFQVGRRAVWSDYYVCRKVASVLPGMLSALEEQFVRSTEEFSNDCATARARLAATKDRARVHGDLCSSGFRFFIVAARLLGHLDGLSCQFKTACRIAPVYLDAPELTSTFGDLHGKLRHLWKYFPNWSDLDELQSILVAMGTALKRV